LQYKCLTDLYFLGTEIFGWKTAKEGWRRRVDPVFHKWVAWVLSLDEDVMALLPRGHLKSTWVKAKIVQDIIRNPDIRIGLFSVASRLVEQELADIKRLLATPLLRRLFPDIIPDPGKDFGGWDKSTATQLTVYREKNTGKSLQSEQVTALGSGSHIAGFHVDKAYLDDIIDPTTVTTAAMMQKTEEWWGYINSVLEVTGTITIIGTRYHYSDIYGKILKERHFKPKNIFVRKAIENGTPIYSTWFTKEDLDKIRKRQSNYVHNCQYYQNPLPVEDQIFPPPQPTFATLPEQEYSYYVAIDPAATTEAYSDRTGFVVAAFSKIGKVYIVEASGLSMKGNELADYLIRKCIQYKPVKVGIEFGLQEHLRYIIEAKRADFEKVEKVTVPLNIVSIPISRKMSKATRINLTLGAFMREGKLVIKETLSDILAQLGSFTGRGNEEDDIVDAASMVFSIVDKLAGQYWFVPEGFSRPAQTFMDIFKKDRKEGFDWREAFVQ
jgi:hypothetical protein